MNLQRAMPWKSPEDEIADKVERAVALWKQCQRG